MYIPTLHEQPDLGALHALIRAHPLATWATHGDGEPIVWQLFSKTVPSVVVFHGPAAYVGPS